VSRTPGPRDLAGLVAAIPHGDKGAAAVEATTRIAFYLLDDADRNGQLMYVDQVLTRDSPVRAQINAGTKLRAEKHAHIVADPVTHLQVHVLRVSGNMADVRISYHHPAIRGVTSTGQVIEDDPPFDATEIFVMVYVGDQWRLSTTKAA
jgi:hypothetical protein